MIRLVTGRRRLLRKRMYKAPHERQRNKYFRENKNYVKSHHNEFKNMERIERKRRPKREVEGFKMSYRYRYYNDDIIDEDEE